MNSRERHQCLVYEGAPSRQLPALAAVMQRKLAENYRCLYLNIPAMVAGMGSALAAAGIDVHRATSNGSLLLSSDREHLISGHFDIDSMIKALADALEQALRNGYRGLWASGDMTWEMGPHRDYSKLVEYERRLDDFCARHPQFIGICQYHADSLSLETARQGLTVHPTVFVGEEVTFPNPYFVPVVSLTDE